MVISLLNLLRVFLLELFQLFYQLRLFRTNNRDRGPVLKNDVADGLLTQPKDKSTRPNRYKKLKLP